MSEQLTGVSLSLCEVRLTLEFGAPVLVEPQPVVTLRGVLGRALAAHFGVRDGVGPPDGGYARLFKPPQGVPHPFVIHAAPGPGVMAALRARLVFFGEGGGGVRPCLEALEAAQYLGWGRDRVPMRVRPGAVTRRESVFSGGKEAAEGVLRVHFETPAQLTWRHAPLRPDGPLVHTVVWAAVRRLRALAEHYGHADDFDPEAVEALVAASQVTRSALYPVEARRRSSLSGEEVPVGGLGGWFEVEGPPALAGLLRPAEWTGLGGKVFAGNGRVRVAPGW